MAAGKVAPAPRRLTHSRPRSQGRSLRSRASSRARDDGGARHLETEIGSWREVGEERFAQFLFVARFKRLRLGHGRRASRWPGDQLHRLLIVELEVDEKLRIGDAQGEELGDGRRGFEWKGDVE